MEEFTLAAGHPKFTVKSLSLILAVALIASACGSKAPQKQSRSAPITNNNSAGKALRLQMHASKMQKEASAWNAACSADGVAFSVEFRSPSGDVTNDDMMTNIRWSDGNVTTVPLKPGWFMPDVEMTSDIPNICNRIVGHKLGNSNLIEVGKLDTSKAIADGKPFTSNSIEDGRSLISFISEGNGFSGVIILISGGTSTRIASGIS